MKKKQIIILGIVIIIGILAIFIIKTGLFFGADYLYNRGVAEMKSGDHGDYREAEKLKEAAIYFEKAIFKGIKTREIFDYLSTCYMWTNDYNDAEKAFTKGLRYYPKDFEFYFYRGASREKLKKFREAILDYDQVAILDSTKKYLASAIYERGALKYMLGQQVEAKIDWKKANDLAPNEFNRDYVDYIRANFE